MIGPSQGFSPSLLLLQDMWGNLGPTPENPYERPIRQTAVNREPGRRARLMPFILSVRLPASGRFRQHSISAFGSVSNSAEPKCGTSCGTPGGTAVGASAKVRRHTRLVAPQQSARSGGTYCRKHLPNPLPKGAAACAEPFRESCGGSSRHTTVNVREARIGLLHVVRDIRMECSR